MDKRIKQHFSKPLHRRKSLRADQRAISTALERIDDRVLGNAVLPDLARSAKDAGQDLGEGWWKTPAYVSRMVLLAKALYISRRISRSKHVFFASSSVETINEERWLDGEFNDELREINQRIEAIENEAGLRPDDYWPKGETPELFRAQYDSLHNQYNAVLEKHFISALREFGLDDLAELREQNRNEFDRLRERGRRSVFQNSSDVTALRDVIVRQEEEAHRAASAKAYTAGIIMLGACLEGLLLIRCLRSKQKAVRTARALGKRLRPQSPDDPSKWRFETLIAVCLLANWLPRISTEYAQYAPAALADVLRNMRNLVHPGRCIREAPWSETDERDYKDAEAIYVTLRSKLLGRRSLTDTNP